MNKNVFKVICGRVMSFLGTGIYAIVVPLYILKLTGNLGTVGIYYALIRIPALILTPHMGVIVEKVNKKKALIVSDFLSGILFGILAFVFGIYKIQSILVLGIVSAICEVTANVFSISSSALFTEITIDEEREKANAYKSLADNACYIISPVLGMIIYGHFGIIAILVINSISFIVSACCEMLISYHKDTSITESKNKFKLKEYREVAGWLKKHIDVLSLLMIAMILNFFVSPSDEVIFPGIVIQKYNMNETFYGYCGSMFIIGSIVANVIIARTDFVSKLELKKLFIVNSVLMMFIGIFSLIFISLNHIIYYVIYMVLLFATGGIITMINVPMITKFQTNVPVEMQGRFFALLTIGSNLLIPAGTAYAGLMCALIGADKLIIMSNIIVILVVMISMRNSIKETAAKNKE